MIVDDLDAFRRTISPRETDSPLVVDPNTVLPLSVTGQQFEPVSRHRCHVLQHSRVVQHSQFAPCHVLNIAESPTSLAFKELLSLLAAEGSDHMESISWSPLNELQ